MAIPRTPPLLEAMEATGQAIQAEAWIRNRRKEGEAAEHSDLCDLRELWVRARGAWSRANGSAVGLAAEGVKYCAVKTVMITEELSGLVPPK